ncbi:uncharacterized protein LOC124616018 [Schistocerca americana]|uniref:uncharacterized protein LOC124616018 n=1 Tax=Schistocerca americana TaxID=7009 RepID=UPI001F4F3FD6|nr:uncharacterized protein LOC124616018 [Schistocerca americana]
MFWSSTKPNILQSVKCYLYFRNPGTGLIIAGASGCVMELSTNFIITLSHLYDETSFTPSMGRIWSNIHARESLCLNCSSVSLEYQTVLEYLTKFNLVILLNEVHLNDKQ